MRRGDRPRRDVIHIRRRMCAPDDATMTDVTPFGVEIGPKTMKTYEIREQDYTFATIEARDAESALCKAERLYPRRACDGYTGPVTWRAYQVGGDQRSSRVVVVR